MHKFFLITIFLTNICFSQSSFNSLETDWEGNWWSFNNNQGSWFPDEVSLLNFSIDDFSWGQVRSISQVPAGSSINIEAQVFANTGGVNGDGAFFCIGDGWITYEGNNYGLVFTNGNIFFYESGTYMDSIGTYEVGKMLDFTITFNNDASITVQGDGFSGTYTPITQVQNAKWIIANSNSISYQGFYLKAIDGTPVSIDDEQSLIVDYLLSQNYPNPFNPSTKIHYSLPVENTVSLKVYDFLGNQISTLINEKKTAGNYEVEFDGSTLSSGVYFYRLQVGNFIQTKKMILLK